MQLAGVLSGPVPLILRLASLFTKDKRRVRKAAAVSGIVGSLLMRYGWVLAGRNSSRDWAIPLEIEYAGAAAHGYPRRRSGWIDHLGKKRRRPASLSSVVKHSARPRASCRRDRK